MKTKGFVVLIILGMLFLASSNLATINEGYEIIDYLETKQLIIGTGHESIEFLVSDTNHEDLIVTYSNVSGIATIVSTVITWHDHTFDNTTLQRYYYYSQDSGDVFVFKVDYSNLVVPIDPIIPLNESYNNALENLSVIEETLDNLTINHTTLLENYTSLDAIHNDSLNQLENATINELAAIESRKAIYDSWNETLETLESKQETFDQMTEDYDTVDRERGEYKARIEILDGEKQTLEDEKEELETSLTAMESSRDKWKKEAEDFLNTFLLPMMLGLILGVGGILAFAVLSKNPDMIRFLFSKRRGQEIVDKAIGSNIIPKREYADQDIQKFRDDRAAEELGFQYEENRSLEKGEERWETEKDYNNEYAARYGKYSLQFVQIIGEKGVPEDNWIVFVNGEKIDNVKCDRNELLTHILEYKKEIEALHKKNI